MRPPFGNNGAAMELENSPPLPVADGTVESIDNPAAEKVEPPVKKTKSNEEVEEIYTQVLSQRVRMVASN